MIIIAIAAVLAPLMLLLGLKTGVIETAKLQLLDDPRNLEIRIYQNARLTSQWFEEIRSRDDVLFALPRTRTINSTIDLVTSKRRILQSVEMIPTEIGDPLLAPNVPPLHGEAQIIISAATAESLDLSPGDTVMGVVRRRIEGKDERLELPLEVIAALPEHVLPRRGVFVSLPLLLASEDYRDGGPVSFVDDVLSSPNSEKRIFANARLYATGLEEVLALARLLRSQGLEVRTRAADIESIKSMDRVLTFVFLVIAVLAGLGGAIALGANVWVNVDRKRRDLALLRLMGVEDSGVLMVPVWQALASTIAAFGLGYLCYSIGAMALNRQLAAGLPDQGYACILKGDDLVLMLCVVLAVACLASIAAGVQATRLDPAECLREIP